MSEAILSAIRASSTYQRFLEDIRARIPLSGMGLARSARLPLLAALVNDLNVPVVLMTGRSDQALALLDELGFWLKNPRRFLFPEPNPLFYEKAAWGTNTRRDRLQALTALSGYHFLGQPKPAIAPVIVAPIRALMTRTMPRRDFVRASKVIKVGQTIATDELQRAWVDIGYEPADVVLEPGQFSHRGGILDIWALAETYPARLDFFGNELDTMRSFDPATQRTIQRIEKLQVTPAREFIRGKAQGMDIPPDQLDEFYLPQLHSSPASIIDYLPQSGLIVADDLELIQTAANEIEEQAVRIREENIHDGLLRADFPIPYLSWSELQDEFSTSHLIELGFSTSEEPTPIAQSFTPGARFGGRVKQVIEHLQSLSEASEPVFVVSRQIGRLKELWTGRGMADGPIVPEFLDGTLSSGWVFSSLGNKPVHLLSDSEIFGWERPHPRARGKAAAEAPEASYADLKPGDWVVHIDYGIGKYAGLVQRTLDGSAREFLCVEYAEGDQLFVPVHQADRLSRYLGPDGSTPTPTRLGSGEWVQTRHKVREAVLEIAQDLLELYAKRQVSQGHSFPTDTVWQQELEASFPYVETEDQMKAIAEVKKDMESTRPMDRLLCGDVGYGKTEVALRAAFKAVMDGRQVAILVPTTVLAQQHYETFKQRLAAFPVQVEMLSRFRTPKEQEEILIRLALGDVDIIIGTHRLIQPDVVLKDLGLLIIDEEQRFGVTHKEYFKKLRTEVDVLTLTATPIPRTLYMAMTGVRDISVINTPPAERLPIITHIGPYEPKLVRQAILRELERGGQVFFVHNRVQTIQAMLAHLNKLVPEARVGVGHGQMHEDQLAGVMHSFTQGKIDVLLCTSIIESGLDIPNANTLIVDRGDMFGLAQLYQLRGRVGRGAQRAYAYFFRHRKKSPTLEGQERLEVIAENTQLGAGYSIAMRDLEMRGAGELLGSRQHGYIASVGFHLYTRMLAQAVGQIRQMSGLPAPDTVPGIRELRMAVTVDLPLDIGIPVNYVPDQNLRLGLYRRIAELGSAAEIDSLLEEFRDRFGVPPQPVLNLFFQIRVRLMAEEAGLASVTLEGAQMVLRYPPLPEGAQHRTLSPIGYGARVGKNAYWMAMDPDEQTWRTRLTDVLTAILQS